MEQGAVSGETEFSQLTTVLPKMCTDLRGLVRMKSVQFLTCLLQASSISICSIPQPRLLCVCVSVKLTTTNQHIYKTSQYARRVIQACNLNTWASKAEEWVQSQLVLYSKFHGSLSYTPRPCLIEGKPGKVAWRDASAVRHACCSCRTGFPATLTLTSEDPAPSSGLQEYQVQK